MPGKINGFKTIVKIKQMSGAFIEFRHWQDAHFSPAINSWQVFGLGLSFFF